MMRVAMTCRAVVALYSERLADLLQRSRHRRCGLRVEYRIVRVRIQSAPTHDSLRVAAITYHPKILTRCRSSAIGVRDMTGIHLVLLRCVKHVAARALLGGHPRCASSHPSYSPVYVVRSASRAAKQ